MSDEVNPYASPETTASPVRAKRGRHDVVVYPFESGHVRAIVCVCLFVVTVLLAVVAVGSNQMQVQLLQEMQMGRKFPMAQLNQNDHRVQAIAVVGILLHISTVIAFLTWVNRTHRNLGALGARSLEFTPGSAVWWFFIPIANLVRPYQILKEIWQWSEPRIWDRGAPGRRRGAVLVFFWWILFLTMNLANRLSVSGSNRPNTPIGDLINSTQVAMFADAVGVAGAILAILMIRRIDRDQDERYQIVGDLTLAGDRVAELPAINAEIVGSDEAPPTEAFDVNSESGVDAIAERKTLNRRGEFDPSLWTDPPEA